MNFFMFVFLISNHMVFLIQIGINLHLGVFEKAEIALTEAAPFRTKIVSTAHRNQVPEIIMLSTLEKKHNKIA